MRVGRKKTEEAKQEEPEVKIIPAIDRLEEYYRDMNRISAMEGKAIEFNPAGRSLYVELLEEAIKDFNTKWGLTT